MARRGKSKAAYGLKTLQKKVKKYREEILNGYVLAIDPSCASTSSMPGYAIYRSGKLEECGILEIEGVSRDVGYRLQDIRRDLESFETPDVVVVEHIPARRYGGGGATGHASLLMAMGVALASTNAEVVLTVRPATWHSMKPPTWEKDDAMDAVAIGHCIIEIAKQFDTGG